VAGTSWLVSQWGASETSAPHAGRVHAGFRPAGGQRAPAPLRCCGDHGRLRGLADGEMGASLEGAASIAYRRGSEEVMMGMSLEERVRFQPVADLEAVLSRNMCLAGSGLGARGRRSRGAGPSRAPAPCSRETSRYCHTVAGWGRCPRKESSPWLTGAARSGASLEGQAAVNGKPAHQTAPDGAANPR